jgi:hypothetical protein
MSIGLLNFIMTVGPWLMLAVAVAVGYFVMKHLRHRRATSAKQWAPYTRTIEGHRPQLEIGVRRFNSFGKAELMAIETVSAESVASEPDLLHQVQAKAQSTASRLNARSEQYDGF